MLHVAKHMLHPARLLRPPTHTPSPTLSPRRMGPIVFIHSFASLAWHAPSGGVFRCSATSDLGRPGKINGLPAELQEGIHQLQPCVRCIQPLALHPTGMLCYRVRNISVGSRQNRVDMCVTRRAVLCHVHISVWEQVLRTYVGEYIHTRRRSLLAMTGNYFLPTHDTACMDNNPRMSICTYAHIRTYLPPHTHAHIHNRRRSPPHGTAHPPPCLLYTF